MDNLVSDLYASNNFYNMNPNYGSPPASDSSFGLAEELRSTEEIPHPYQQIFNQYRLFNVLQSTVFDNVFHTDDHIVISAPTGSGKTAIFEMAIARLLQTINYTGCTDSFKIIYVAPMKALCEERVVDWHAKFKDLGVKCVSVTGDSENIDMKDIANHNLIVSTPEKWDSLTRKWKDNKELVRAVKLFMIDEIHLLNEDGRGSTLEAVVSRMKIIQEYHGVQQKIRFLAVSATIPNVEDVAEWIDASLTTVKYFQFPEDIRPVKLNKIVLGYPYYPHGSSPFKFDIMLSYKLQSIMLKYSEGKPVLIFCSTRKSVEMTAKHITLNLTITLNEEQRQFLREAAKSLTDANVREFLIHGIGCHHAGMLSENRKLIENLFRNGNLPILVTTSTLAMGVNLPAHLVIVKMTKFYQNGEYRDYSESAIQQMIGRAGRPTFDTSAYAVIMTTTQDKEKFENMVEGNQNVESNLHKHLNEHLNSEVVLRTVTDLGIAMQWLTSTFLYIRAKKNPKHYGLNTGLSIDQIDKKLLEMCQIEINKLAKANMLTIDETTNISPTYSGCLMAKYYLGFETMKLITQITGSEILPQMVNLISKCQEFSDMFLRVTDKKTLNLLNSCRNRGETIRYPLSGRIKTSSMKVNCIIQAAFGNLQITEHSLQNESEKIMRSGERIAHTIVEYLSSEDFQHSHPKSFSALLSSVTLAKCFKARLWENSVYVVRQLPGIGYVMSSLLAAAGKTSFKSILEANPRDIERIINRKPPFGNNLQELVQHLPQYNVIFEEIDNAGSNIPLFNLHISLENAIMIQEKCTANINSGMVLLVGDSLNNIIIYERYSHCFMIGNNVEKVFEANSNEPHEVKVFFISDNWVGFDYEGKISVNNEAVPKEPQKESSKELQKAIAKKRQTPIKAVTKTNRKSHIQSFMDKYLKNTKNISKDSRVIQKKNSSASNSTKTTKSKPESNINLLTETQKIIPVQNQQEKALIDGNDDDEEPEKVENSFAQFVEKYNAEKNLQQSTNSNNAGDLSDDSIFEKSLPSEDQEEGTLVYTEESLYDNDVENKENLNFTTNKQKSNIDMMELKEKCKTGHILNQPKLITSKNTFAATETVLSNVENRQPLTDKNFPKKIENQQLTTGRKSPKKAEHWPPITDKNVSKEIENRQLRNEKIPLKSLSSNLINKKLFSLNPSVKPPVELGGPWKKFQKTDPTEKFEDKLLFNIQDSGCEKSCPDSTSGDNQPPQTENPFDGICKDSYAAAKSLTWRSPLVVSPIIKFSPKSPYILQRNKRGSNVKILSSEDFEEKTKNAPLQKTPTAYKKDRPQFALTDQAYSQNTPTQNIPQNQDTSKPKTLDIPDELHDLCSDSLWSQFFNISKTSSDTPIQRNVTVKNNLSSCTSSQKRQRPKSTPLQTKQLIGDFSGYLSQFKHPKSTLETQTESAKNVHSVSRNLKLPQSPKQKDSKWSQFSSKESQISDKSFTRDFDDFSKRAGPASEPKRELSPQPELRILRSRPSSNSSSSIFSSPTREEYKQPIVEPIPIYPNVIPQSYQPSTFASCSKTTVPPHYRHPTPQKMPTYTKSPPRKFARHTSQHATFAYPQYHQPESFFNNEWPEDIRLKRHIPNFPPAEIPSDFRYRPSPSFTGYSPNYYGPQGFSSVHRDPHFNYRHQFPAENYNLQHRREEYCPRGVEYWNQCRGSCCQPHRSEPRGFDNRDRQYRMSRFMDDFDDDNDDVFCINLGDYSRRRN